MTDPDRGTSGDEGRPSSKVARLIDEYDLGEAFGARLETLWTGDADERRSLRDLADLFNCRLLEAAVARGGTTTVDGEIENLYRLLTDDDVTSGTRIEARAQLERAGVDIDDVERNFVTYQAIRSYLTDYRGAEYEPATEVNRLDKVTNTIQRLLARTRAVTKRNLTQLRDTGRITLGSFQLFVEVSVLCDDCNTQYEVIELLKRGGCDCPRSE